MAAFNGSIVRYDNKGDEVYSRYTTPRVNSSPPLYIFSLDGYGGTGSIVDNDQNVGVRTDNTPISFSNPKSLSGSITKSPESVFYNRVLIEPKIVDLGNLTSNQITEFKIINNFFYPIVLSEFTSVVDSGISISSFNLPIEIPPLGVITFEVLVTALGPVSVDAQFDFIFLPSVANSTIRITGTRVVTFPYLISQNATETLSWDTSVLTSKNGKEQRLTTRFNPRQKISGNSFIGSGELIRANNLFNNWRDKKWAVPIQFERSNVLSPISQGDTVIQVDTTYHEYEVGSLLTIWESPRKYQTIKIESLTDTEITVSQQISDSYLNAIVSPTRIYTMTDDPSLKTNGYDGVIDFSFTSQDNKRISSSLGAQPFSDGIEVFDLEPLSKEGIVDNIINADVNLVDYSTGVIGQFSSWIDRKNMRSIVFIADGKEETRNIKEWLHRRIGRAVPYYSPSYTNDFEVLQGTQVITSIIVKKNDHLLHGSTRTKIGLLTHSSGWVYAAITGISELNETTEVIDIDRTLNINQSDIRISSYVSLKRLASDNIAITWKGNNVAIFTIPEIEIEL